MTDFKDQWNVAMAMEVLKNPTVDSKLWSEAVKWLLLYGPPETKELILQASGMATDQYFPELKPHGFTEDGDPCFDIRALADALGITEEEALEKLKELEEQQRVRFVIGPDETNKIQ